MHPFLWFIVSIFSVLIFVILTVLRDDPQGFKNLIRDKVEGKKVKAGWWMFIGVFILIAAGSLLFSGGSSAEPTAVWLPYGKIEAGIGLDFEDTSIFCKEKKNTSRNRIQSDGRIIIGIVEYGRFYSHAGFLHHSCVAGVDYSPQDSFTFHAGWYLWDKR